MNSLPIRGGMGRALCLTLALAPCGARAQLESKKVFEASYVWKNVEIVGGGFIPGIVFSPKQPDLIYARTDIGGAYRWNPTTKRWIPLTDWVGSDNANLLGVESIMPDPTDANRVYAAIGTYTQSWASNGAIVRSTDQGRHWKQTDMPFKMGGNEDGRSAGERLAVDPNKNSVIYFGSRSDGLWRSSDYAATWSKVETFPVTAKTNGIGVIFVLFDRKSGAAGKPSPVIYVGVSSPDIGLYRSRDGGATWEPLPGQPKGLLPHHGVLTPGGSLYVSYGNAPGPNGMSDGAVWKCDLKSEAWTNVSPVRPDASGTGRLGFGYAGLSVDAKHPNVIMVASMDKWSTGDDIYRSVDGGANWKSLKVYSVRDSSGAPFLNWNRGSADLGHWIGALAIDPFHSGHVLYGTGATMWGSDDADLLDADKPTHWTVRAQGLEETAVIDLISPPAGAHLVSAMGDIGGFRHEDVSKVPASGMMQPILNTVESIDFAGKAPNILARVGNGAGNLAAQISTDGGATWAPFATVPASRRAPRHIAVSADGSAIVLTADSGISYHSADRGATWTPCEGLTNKASVISDRVNPAAFYAWDADAGKIYASADGGATFAAQGTFAASRSKLFAAPGREGDLWLTSFQNGLFHSTDAGKTFTRASGVLEGYALGFGKAAPGQLYPALYITGKIGEVKGVFRSDDSGANWTRINDDAHQYGWIGQVVTGDPRLYGRVYLGTNGRGILYADPANGRQAAGK